LKKLEIERRFLVKKEDVGSLYGVLCKRKVRSIINQMYSYDEQKNIVRYRYEHIEGRNSKVQDLFYKTKKKFISDGVFEEDEVLMDHVEWIKELDKFRPHKQIIKWRFKVPYKGFIFEIDFINKGTEMCIIEIELDDINQHFEFLPLLKKYELTEITGKQEYSNYSLAKTV